MSFGITFYSCDFLCRYGSETFSEVSQMTLMSYKELKEQLGWDHDISLTLFTPPVSAKKKTTKAPKHKKHLSFLSDSQYLASPPSTLTSESELDEACVDSDSGSESHSSLRISDSGSSSLSASLSESHSYIDPDFAFFVSSPPGCGLHSPSPSSSPSRCSSQSLVVNPNELGFPQPDFHDALEEDRRVYDQFVAAYESLSSLREISSSRSSPRYEPTTVEEEPHHLIREDAISCSTSATSVASGSTCSGNSVPAFADEDSKFSNDDKMSVFVDEDSRSLMDTLLPPGPSSSQTNNLSTFVSNLPPLLTSTLGSSTSFGGALERGTENTPFEIHPTTSTTSGTSLAGVKENLQLGSCETKRPSQHPHPSSTVNPRVPLQSLENLVQEPCASMSSSKNVVPSAKSGRGRNFVAKDTYTLVTENKLTNKGNSSLL